MGVILEEFLELVLDMPEENTKERLLARLSQRKKETD